MKKIISVIVLCAILSCAVLEVTVSAAGEILWKEDFSTKVETNWLWDGTAFYIDDGVLKGWDEAKVHQSYFPTSLGGTRKYRESAWRIEAIGYEDGGSDVETHSVGLWYADYIDPYATDDPTSWIVYKPHYNFEAKTFELEMEFTGDEAEAYRPANFPEDCVVFRKEISADKAPTLGGGWFSMGIRINAGVVSLFLNDEKIVDFPAYRGAKTCTERPSPVLLLNGGCFCGFDNLTVSTPDYNLFNETGDITPVPGPSETETEKVVVTDTDESGNVVTRVEVRPVASTGGSASGGTSAKTGDAAIIALAAMIVSLGAAIVVWKVRER